MSRRRLTWILGALSALGPLSIDTAVPALPSMARALGASASAVQLTLAAYLAGIAAGQLLHGPLSDRLGRKPPLLAGLALYTLASVAGALAPSLRVIWAARFAQGFGACAVIAVSRAVVRDHCAGRDAASLYSARMLVGGAAPVLAPFLGGLLVATSGWRAVFVVLALAGLALSLLVATALPESLHPERALSGLRDTLRGAAAAFRDRRFLRMAVAGGASEAALFACLSGASFVFIERFGLSPERFGLVGAANALGIVGASLVGRRLVRAVGVARALRAGAGAAVASYAALVAAVQLGAGIGSVLAAMVAGVSSVGVVLPSATAAAMDGRGDGAGSASAVLGVLQSTIGALAAGSVSLLADGTPLPMALVMLACGGIALLLVLGTRGRARTSRRSTRWRQRRACVPSRRGAPASRARGRRSSGPEHLEDELPERGHLARHVLRGRRDDVQAPRGPLELRDDPDERAGDHVRLRHEGRQEPDPDARPHGVPHEQEVVAHDPRSALRRGAHGGDPQLLGTAPEHDPVVLVQLVRGPRRPPPRQVDRRGEQLEQHRGGAPDDERRVLELRRDAQRDVEPFADEVHHPAGEVQVHRHAGVPGRVAGEDLGEEEHPQVDRGGDLQRPRRRLAALR